MCKIIIILINISENDIAELPSDTLWMYFLFNITWPIFDQVCSLSIFSLILCWTIFLLSLNSFLRSSNAIKFNFESANSFNVFICLFGNFKLSVAVISPENILIRINKLNSQVVIIIIIVGFSLSSFQWIFPSIKKMFENLPL